MSPDKVLEIAVQIAVLLFAVSFHESAHGYVAMRCGDNTARDLGRITLNPLKHIDPIGSVLFPLVLAFTGGPIFGWAKPVPISLRGVPNPRKANLLISAAGPISNLLLAVLFAGAFQAMRFAGLGGDRKDFLFPLVLVCFAAVLVNASLAVFNLIPLPPLDGFGVLESLLPARFWSVTHFLRRFGFVILFAAVYLGLLNPVFRLVFDPLRAWLLGMPR